MPKEAARRGSRPSPSRTGIWTCGLPPGAGQLPPDQREALILVGAAGFSYEEAQRFAAAQSGTIKSRVNRARVRLAGLLHVDGAEGFQADEAAPAPMLAETARR